MNSPRALILFLALAIIALGAAGCARRQTAVEHGIRAQILHQGNGSEPQDLDPHLLQFNQHFNIAMALGEGLIGYDPHDLHPIPGAAERWEISPDGLIYTLHLRSDGRWSNGDPVTAHDFVFSARRMLSPALGSPFRYYYDDVRGAKEFSARGAGADFSSVGVRALDDRTLQIELAHPAAYFLFLLGNYSWYPVHRPTLERYGRFDQPYSGWTKPGRFVGNGPFTLAEWRAGQAVVVKKNPRYWDAAHVKLNEIHFHFYENADSEERAFRAGQLHITETVPSSKLAPYAARQPSPLVVAPFFSTYFYGFNVTRPPFDDARVRRAFSLAIDRERVAASQPGSEIRPAFSFVPPATVGYTYEGEARLRFDPVEAQRLLAESGFPGGRGFPPVQFNTNTNLRHQEIAEVVQRMWQQHLGVQVSIANKEGKVFFDERQGGRFQIARNGWVGDFLDPFAFLTAYLAGSGHNDSRYISADYDRLVLAAARTSDEPTRLLRFREAETILLRDLPIMPLFYDTTRHLVHPSVRGRFPTLLNFHPYQHMWLESSK
jgi:oligopeptide transport system substrate-binding protein